MTKTPERCTFVLIPGAGIEPGVWTWTITGLRELGHEGMAPALPLDDLDAAPSDHAEAIVGAVADRSGPLVIVGQSLGAYAASLVAHRIPVSALILIAPMVPAPGETAGEWWSAVEHEQAIPQLRRKFGPTSAWGPDAMRHVFLHDVPEDIIRDAERYNGSPGSGMFAEPWPLTSWPTVATHVLAPREDRLFPLDFQRRVTSDRLGLEVQEIPGGHLPMLARPQELAERLVAIYRQSG